jgi:hypothetical protein
MKKICSDLLDKLAPGFKSTSLLSETQMTDALARMIRDVDKGVASADYDMGSVDDMLKCLGSLPWRRNPLWEWARQYNHFRASESDRFSFLGEEGTRPTSGASASASRHSTLDPSTREKSTWHRLARRREKGGIDARDSDGRSLRVPSSPLVETPLSPRPQAPPQAAFHFWEDVLATLDAAPEFKLRFAMAENIMLEEEYLVLVCDGASTNDQIYQVEHSILPLVLRKSDNYFDLIGEVCISRQESGEWNHELVEDTTHDPFQPRAWLRDAKTLYIRLEDEGLVRRPSYASLYSS